VIHVLRHGRTAANAGGLLLGRRDPPLDEEGERQAALVASRLAAMTMTEVRVVSSPLQRCRQTAAVVASALGVEVELDERWIELDYGELDGVALADVPASTWSTWRADVTWRPPGGESLAELGARVRVACEELAPIATDVVVVTHVSPVKAAVAWALGVGDEVTWRMFVAPASLTTVAVRAGLPSLHTFNDTAHLAR
jgi:broad specificity phosphatase PhoE